MAFDIEEARAGRQPQIKRNTRDSVFTLLFSEPKYQLQAYKALHPEDITVTQEDVKPLTLNNVFVNTYYNDLGISIRDTNLILIEAQSTWSYNILVRLLNYYVYTCERYIQNQDYSKYSEKKLRIPIPEFYVVYVGEPKELPEFISLSKEFFGGNSTYLELKARVLQKERGDDILSQYIEFSKIYRTMSKAYRSDRKRVIEETIRVCKESNILYEFLKSREREVYTMLENLWDEEREQMLFNKEKEKEYEEKGRYDMLKTSVKAFIDLGFSTDIIAEKLNVSEDEVMKVLTEL